MKRPKRIRVVAVAGMATWLAGCGENSATREEQPIPVEESVFGEQVEQMHRAEERAREMENRKNDLDAQLEEVEGTRSNDRED